MFDSHFESLCKKARQKLNALSRVAYQLDYNQRKLLLNAFIKSQFSYAPVVWMFHSRTQHHHINCIHEWTLKVVYKELCPVTPGIWVFVRIFNEWQWLTIYTWNFVLCVSGVLDLQLGLLLFYTFHMYICM